MITKQLLIAGFVLSLSGSGAHAVKTTYIIDFTASGFDPWAGPAPTDPVVGSFTITFDPAVTTDIVGTSVVVNSINIPGGTKPYFVYFPNTALFGSVLTVCSSADPFPNCTVGAGQNSYHIQINYFQSTPRFGNVAYSVPGTFVRESSSGSVSISTERNRPLSPFAQCLRNHGRWGRVAAYDFFTGQRQRDTFECVFNDRCRRSEFPCWSNNIGFGGQPGCCRSYETCHPERVSPNLCWDERPRNAPYGGSR